MIFNLPRHESHKNERPEVVPLQRDKFKNTPHFAAKKYLSAERERVAVKFFTRLILAADTCKSIINAQAVCQEPLRLMMD